MNRIFKFLPELQGEELMYVQQMTSALSDEKMATFANVYRARRKDPQTILILAIASFLGIHGLQRFYTNQIGMGVLYLFTGGLCFIGTIIDIVNYQKLTQEYNTIAAREVLAMMENGIITTSTGLTE